MAITSIKIDGVEGELHDLQPGWVRLFLLGKDMGRYPRHKAMETAERLINTARERLSGPHEPREPIQHGTNTRRAACSCGWSSEQPRRSEARLREDMDGHLARVARFAQQRS